MEGRWKSSRGQPVGVLRQETAGSRKQKVQQPNFRSFALDGTEVVSPVLHRCTVLQLPLRKEKKKIEIKKKRDRKKGQGHHGRSKPATDTRSLDKIQLINSSIRLKLSS